MRNQFTDPTAPSPRGLQVARHLNVVFALTVPALIAVLVAFASLPRESLLLGEVLSEGAGVFPLRQSQGAKPNPSDFWKTDGANIIDGSGQVVTIKGINWSGLETSQACLGGLEHRSLELIIDDIHKEGFNTIRVPFSNEVLERSSRSSCVDGPRDSKDPTSEPLKTLDHLIEVAGKRDLKVILDNHRSEAGSSAEASGLWYTPDFPETAWIADWTRVARRYKDNPTVVAFDLRNEPHNTGGKGACWGCGEPLRDWAQAAERAGNAILDENPRALIMVEGTDQVGRESTWWGGNLAAVLARPIRLSQPGHIIYSVHEYGPSEYQQAWFNSSSTGSLLRTLWDRRWGYIVSRNLAPVVVGEFGTGDRVEDVRSSVAGSQGWWFQEFINYLAEKPQVGWIYWGINGEDRYGYMTSDYSLKEESTPIRHALQELINTTGTRPVWAGSLGSRSMFVGDPPSKFHIIGHSHSTTSAGIKAAIASAVQQSTRQALSGTFPSID